MICNAAKLRGPMSYRSTPTPTTLTDIPCHSVAAALGSARNRVAVMELQGAGTIPQQ